MKNYIKNLLKILLTCFITLPFGVIGILLKATFDWGGDVVNAANIALIIIFAVIILLIPFNVISFKVFEKQLNQTKLKDLQSQFLRQREEIDKEYQSLLEKLNKYLIFIDIYSFSFCFLGATAAFLSGIALENPTMLIILSMIPMHIGLLRIRFAPKSIFYDSEVYVEKRDYPTIYAIAERAKNAIGIKGPLKIAILCNDNAGIARIGNVVSLQIGVELLSLFDDEELYCVLLHEFTHLQKQLVPQKIKNYADWNNNSGHVESVLGYLFFGYANIKFLWHYMMLEYAVSVINETEADKAIALYGNKEKGASALIKTHFVNMHAWESGTYNTRPFYENEEPPKAHISYLIDKLHERIALRGERWLELIDKEILANNASHPTTKMRLETLGVTQYTVFNDAMSPELETDYKKAVDFTNNLIYNWNKESYTERRKDYLKDMQKIKEWTEAGKPVVMEEYRLILDALMNVGQSDDAQALCDMVIEQLSGSAAIFAKFIKGMHLLHSLDGAGIPLVYEAVEDNNNYIEEGMNTIGQYACFTGNREELEKYRNLSVDMFQKTKDEYSKLNELTAKDNLSEEHLPDEMLTEVKDFLLGTGKEQLDAIYIVHKTVSESVQASVVILKFDKKCPWEECREIMNKTFVFLDTFSDHQFSLFDYRSVSKIPFDKINGSCIYKKQ